MFNRPPLLSAEDEQLLIEAIKKAELETSGEIRVHFSNRKSWWIKRSALRIFKKLKMHQTELRNSVLVYIEPNSKSFYILGDKGINDKTGNHFWEDIKTAMATRFSEKQFVEGIIEAIEGISQKLVTYFPLMENDKNELSDEITYD